MSTAGCRYEHDILRAAAEAPCPESLRVHARECQDCAAALAVAPWLDQLAAADARQRPLPDPAIVWMKAQLLRGTAGVDRISRPLRVFQLISYFVVAGGWAALLTWKWNTIQSWISGLTPSHVLQTAATGSSLSAAFFAGIFALSSATIVLALHTILAEE